MEIPRNKRSILFCNKMALQSVQPMNWTLKRKKIMKQKKSGRLGIDELGLSGILDDVNPPRSVNRKSKRK